MVSRFFLAVLFISLIPSLGLSQQVIVQDDFDGTALANDWIVHLGLEPPAADWTYSVESGSLMVTDVAGVEVGFWSAVRLRRGCTVCGDFSLECGLSWDETSSPQTNKAMQQLGVALLDTAGVCITRAWYYDPWIASRGTYSAIVGSTSYQGSPSLLPFEGGATVRIERVDSVVSIYWDDQVLISEPDSSMADSLELSFWYYMHEDGSFFGSEAVDWVTVTVPETDAESQSWGGLKGLYR